MWFDRFDICMAHYVFANLWHEGQGSATYAKFAQLNRVRFSPSVCFSGLPKDLDDNAKEIYRQLVVVKCGIHSTHPKASQ
jgi:hypothetical protein